MMIRVLMDKSFFMLSPVYLMWLWLFLVQRNIVLVFTLLVLHGGGRTKRLLSTGTELHNKDLYSIQQFSRVTGELESDARAD